MIGRPLNYSEMAQGTDYVVIPGTPVVLHAPTRELVILRRPLITLGAVDEMDDVVDLSISHIPEQRGLWTAAELLRQLIKQISGDAAKPLYTFEGVSAGAGAARGLNFLLGRRYLPPAARGPAPRPPKNPFKRRRGGAGRGLGGPRGGGV